MKRSSISCWLILMLLVAAPALMAQDAEPAAEAASVEQAAPKATPVETAPAPRSNWLSWTIEACGLFFYPQLAIMIAIVAIVSANAVSSMRTRFVGKGFVEEFDQLVKGRHFKEAFDRARAEPTLLGKMLSAGLQRLPEGYAEGAVALQETGSFENMRNEQRLSYLSMLANVATMVGLLGTVAGMVSSFTVLAESDVSPSPSALAQGVSMALVTTVIGLIEAIPAVMAYTIFSNINGRRLAETLVIGEQLLRPFKQVPVAKKQAPAGPPTEPTSPGQHS